MYVKFNIYVRIVLPARMHRKLCNFRTFITVFMKRCDWLQNAHNPLFFSRTMYSKPKDFLAAVLASQTFHCCCTCFTGIFLVLYYRNNSKNVTFCSILKFDLTKIELNNIK